MTTTAMTAMAVMLSDGGAVFPGTGLIAVVLMSVSPMPVASSRAGSFFKFFVLCNRKNQFVKALVRRPKQDNIPAGTNRLVISGAFELRSVS